MRDTREITIKEVPLWWENSLPVPFAGDELPESADVAVIGGGFAGLSAALELQRAGTKVTLIEKKWPGYGACSRNMGMVLDRIAGTTTGELDDDVHGVQRHELICEGRRAYDFVLQLIEREKINCGLRKRGKLVMATSKSSYEKMARNLDSMEKFFGGVDAYMVPRGDLKQELGGRASQYYFGAKVHPNSHDLNPGQLTAGLVQALLDAGASICCSTQCVSMERLADRKFRIKTDKGETVADQLIVATQGYSGIESGFLHRKIFPFLAHVVATKPLGPELLNELLPTSRGVVDTKQMFFNFRPCDREQRLLLASNYLRTDSDQSQSRRIMRSYKKLFPQLEESDAEYCWHGNLALTADHLPHIGTNNEIHYCAAPSFPMALYMGSKIAKRILRANDAQTIFDQIPLSNFPLYNGDPGFLYMLLRLVFNALDVLKGAVPK